MIRNGRRSSLVLQDREEVVSEVRHHGATPLRTNERVELRHVGDRPHEVAASDGEEDAGADEPNERRRRQECSQGQKQDRLAYVWYLPLGVMNQENAPESIAATSTMRTLYPDMVRIDRDLK